MNELALNRILDRVGREARGVLRPVPESPPSPVPNPPSILARKPLAKTEDKVRAVEFTAPNLADIVRMTILDFSRAGLLLRVRCRAHGGEAVYFASTEKEAAIGRAEGLVTYSAAELAELFKLKPDAAALKTIHEAKRVLEGRIVRPRNDEGTVA